jgi:hypothetical protein
MQIRLGMTALAIGAILAGCQTTQGPITPVGGTVAQIYIDGGNQVPLPDGEWTLVAQDKIVHERVRYNVSVLSREIGNVVSQLVMTNNASPAHLPRFQPYAACESETYLFTAVLENTFRGRQDCWRTLPFLMGAAASNQPHIQAFLDDARARGIAVPAVMMGVGFHVADGPDTIDVFYLWNPDLVVPNQQTGQVWGYQDWTLDAIKQDPRKMAAFEVLRDWAATWHSRVWDGFNNELVSSGS